MSAPCGGRGMRLGRRVAGYLQPIARTQHLPPNTTATTCLPTMAPLPSPPLPPPPPPDPSITVFVRVFSGFATEGGRGEALGWGPPPPPLPLLQLDGWRGRPPMRGCLPAGWGLQQAGARTPRLLSLAPPPPAGTIVSEAQGLHEILKVPARLPARPPASPAAALAGAVGRAPPLHLGCGSSPPPSRPHPDLPPTHPPTHPPTPTRRRTRTRTTTGAWRGPPCTTRRRRWGPSHLLLTGSVQLGTDGLAGRLHHAGASCKCPLRPGPPPPPACSSSADTTRSTCPCPPRRPCPERPAPGPRASGPAP